MPDKFSPASEVATIGNKLIKKHHDHLSGRRVEFLFMERLDKDGNSQAITRKGKSLYGQAKLVTGLNAYLACAPRTIEDPSPFFVILISKHWWTITEFVAIVKRHGLWNHDVEVFVNAAKQQSLQFSEAAELETKQTNRTERGNLVEMRPAST